MTIKKKLLIKLDIFAKSLYSAKKFFITSSFVFERERLCLFFNQPRKEVGERRKC